MNKDLHDIDKLFRSALEGHEEIPSSGVKESLDAALDKKEAESYKKRFIVWKRAALLLLLLLTGFVLYESGILKTGTGRPGQTANDKNPNSAPAKKQKEDYLNDTAAGHTSDITNSNLPEQYDRESVNDKVGNLTNAVPGNDNIPRQPGQKDTPIPGTTEIISGKGSTKRYPVKKIAEQKKVAVNDQPGFRTGHTKAVRPNPDKVNGVAGNNAPLPKEKINPIPPPERNEIKIIARWVAKNISQPLLSPVNDSVLKNSKAKNTKDKKVDSFKPFWMAGSFVSYDRAGYKLDSDEPMAITSLKHREAHEPSFSVGLLLTRQITRRWGLQSGIIYSNVAIGMKPQKTYAFRDPTGDVAYKYITSSGYAFFKPGYGPQPAVGDSLTTAEGKHTIEYISVPLVIKHTISNKKISLTPGAGIEANFITKANLEVDIEDGFNREIVIVKKLTGTKPFYWSFVADAEIKYDLSKKLSLSLRPVYKHAISPITKNNVVETFPHSFGLGLGITIKF